MATEDADLGPAEQVGAGQEQPEAEAQALAPEEQVEPGRELPEAEPKALTPEDEAAPPPGDLRRRERRLRGLWTVGSILSIGLNLVLCLLLLVLGNQLFTLKKLVGADVLGGLYSNFVKMDQAHIRTTINVQDEIPVQFDLPISQDTTVTTTQPAFIQGATLVDLRTGGLTISNAPADITLPAGTTLQVHLEMVVPVDQTVPVTLNVPVDIALDQTDMHEPLVGLQGVVAPFYWMLKPEWITCTDVPVFSRLGPLCKLFFRGP